MDKMTTLICTCVLVLFSSRMATAQNQTEINTLHSTLLTNYNRFVRPSTDVSTATDISVELSVGKINGIDETSGLFSLMGYLIIIWNDERLRWDSNAFSGANEIHMTQSQIWKPEMTLGNSFSETKQLGFKDMMMRIYNGGNVEWRTGDIFDTLCDYDITHFPFDKQKCSLKFNVWGYNSSQLNFIPTSRKVVFLNNFFQESAEWEITSSDALSAGTSENAAIQFDINIMRRPEFFVMNVYVPVMILTLMSTMAFILPTDSGERVGYSVTCLLSIAVFLTIVSDSLPKTSNPISVLGLFLMFDFVFSTAICICTIISLRLYYIDEEKVPRLVRKLVDCLKCKTSHKESSDTSLICAKCRKRNKNKDNKDTSSRLFESNIINEKENQHYHENSNSVKSDSLRRSTIHISEKENDSVNHGEKELNVDDIDQNVTNTNSEEQPNSKLKDNIPESENDHKSPDNEIRNAETVSIGSPKTVKRSKTNNSLVDVESRAKSTGADDPEAEGTKTEDTTDMAIEDLEETTEDIPGKTETKEEVINSSEKTDCDHQLSENSAKKEDNVGQYTWKDVSKVFDKVCFVLANASLIVLVIIYMMFSNIAE